MDLHTEFPFHIANHVEALMPDCSSAEIYRNITNAHQIYTYKCMYMYMHKCKTKILQKLVVNAQNLNITLLVSLYFTTSLFQVLIHVELPDSYKV